MTVAVTLFALLELYKQGEATWEQDEPFGEITHRPAAPPARTREAVGMSAAGRAIARGAAVPRPRAGAEAELADALECSADELAAALARLREDFARAARPGAAPARRRLDARHRPEAEDAARRLLAKPARRR